MVRIRPVILPVIPPFILVFCLLCCAAPGPAHAAPEPQGDSRGASAKASNAVPLDSWVYLAFDRLAALGYIPSSAQGMRPWTRIQCARFLAEAEQRLQDPDLKISDPDSTQAVARLRVEFLYELGILDGFANRSAGMRNAYVRITGISGAPLRDAYHFGQTIYDDFGRPYGEGFNAVGGVDLHAEYGPFAVQLKGEYQHAAPLFDYNAAANEAIAEADVLPVQPLPNISGIDRVRPIEATVSAKLYGWQATFGKQSLWFGQQRSNQLVLSNNAEAPVVLLIQHDAPTQLPSFLAYLGKFNNTFFVGQMSGHHYVRGPYPQGVLFGSPDRTVNPQPFIWGDQLNVKISPNLELGFEIACMWAGYGRPATLATWMHTFNFHGNHQPFDPGKRYGGFHFAYRLPYMRNVTLYTDALSNDEPTPIVYPLQSAFGPGLYIARFPRLPKLDARFEGVYTNIPDYRDGIGSVYFNAHYANGYVNNGQLVGSWVGRAGTAWHAKTTWWFSPINKVDFSVRHQSNDRHFIGGGDLTDYSSSAWWQLKGPWQVHGAVTAERWQFPILRSTPQTTVTATFGVILTPPAKPRN